MMTPVRRSGMFLCAVSLLALSGCQTPGSAQLADAIDVGRGPQGEMCRAERVWGDTAATGMFDEVYSVRCRGWTETQSVGRIYAVTSTPAALASIEQARTERLVCGASVPTQVPEIGAGELRRCIDREGGYDAFTVTVTAGDQVLAVDGISRFNARLLAGLQSVAGKSTDVGSNVEIEVTAAPAPDSITQLVAALADENTLVARRAEVLDYSVRGQHGEAREIVTRYLAKLPTGASSSERVEFLLEAALSESNLGYSDVAAAYLDRADALLAAGEVRGAVTLRTKLQIYRAMDALNRRDFANASLNADGALGIISDEQNVQLASAASTPLLDPSVLRQLNQSQSGRSLRGSNTDWMRRELLRTQALYIQGAARRAQNNLPGAEASFDGASAILAQFERGGLDTANLQWLKSAVAAEQGRIAWRQHRLSDVPTTVAAQDRMAWRQQRLAYARTSFRSSVESLESSVIYADTPLLAQRKLDYASFLANQGDRDEAVAQYDAAMSVLQSGGPSAAAGVTGLAEYFALLAADAQRSDRTGEIARAKFLAASQFINPPAVAAQIAQIQKIFESGSSDAAVRAKTLQDLDREGRALATRISALPSDAANDRAQLQTALDDLTRRAALVRRELSGNEQYQQARDTVASMEELQRGLRPGEAYFKLLTLPTASYGILITATRARVYPLTVPTNEIDRLVEAVRSSIDGNTLADGRVVTLGFNVDAAHQLYKAVLGPAEEMLSDVSNLITEPSGSLTQLPLGVLVSDQASVDWFKANVKKNSRDYTQINFLARRADISTTVSPRAFLVARSQTASRAKLPYIGFGSHTPPVGNALAELPQRGALGGRCAAKAGQLRAAFGALKPIGARELEAASAVLGEGSVVVTGAAFTDAAIDAKRDYRDYAVVHFATHGLKDGELDCDSPPALVTSVEASGSSDGLLSFEEIANLQFDANLVVLSACNTAAEATASRSSAGAGFRSGQAGQGATLNGLVRAFLVAGSRTVLTTHWAIPDTFRSREGQEIAASTRLIEGVFRAGATESIGKSLRDAQSSMIGRIETSHPYYWGAFSIVGDGTKSMLARAS